jgi:hypothetical protein
MYPLFSGDRAKMINCACSASLKWVVIRSSSNQMHASSNLLSTRTKKVGTLVTTLYVSPLWLWYMNKPAWPFVSPGILTKRLAHAIWRHCTCFKRVLYVIKNANFSKTVRYISLFCAVTYVEILHNVLHELHQAIGFLYRVIFVSVCCHSNELCVTKTDINLKKKHQNRSRSWYLLHKT